MEIDALMSDVDGQWTEVDLPDEEALLIRKLRLLEDFVRSDLPETLPPLEQRYRILREIIESTEAMISRAGKTESSRKYLLDPPEVPRREEFINWLISQGFSSASALSSKQQPSFHRGFQNSKELASNADLSLDHVMRDHSPSDVSSNFSSRSRLAKSARAVEKERPPCLRCKILKRKCDSLVQCSLCPQQNDENENDFWKVLGCFRGALRDLSAVFIPPHLRSTSRSCRFRADPNLAFEVSLRKQGGFDDVKWGVRETFRTHNSFAALTDSSWEDAFGRRTLSKTAHMTERRPPRQVGGEPVYENFLEYFQAPWSLLRVVFVDSSYEGKTGYNLFTLMRLGNLFSRIHPIDWAIFIQASQLVCGTVEFYLAEQHILDQVMSYDSLLEANSSEQFSVIDIIDELESLLRTFETVCSSRGKLTGQKQLACFYAVLLLSIFKALLIDGCSLRASYETTNSWRDADAVRINSSYKALVSVFCWSSKSDLMLESSHIEMDPIFEKDLEDTRRMVRTNEWTTWGMKGSKDFLIALGSGLLPDSTFNGFFIQKFGLSTMVPMVSKPSSDLENVLFEPDDSFVSVGIDPYTMTSSDTYREAPALPTYPPGFMTFNPSPLDMPSTFASNSRGKSKSISSMGWEHTVVAQSGLSLVGNAYSGEKRSKSGIRTGRLNPAAKEKARRIRQLRACWNCWILKVPCSEGSVCNRCESQSRKTPGLLRQPCDRSGFKDYESSFFPEFMNSQLRKSYILDYIDRNANRFLSETFDIHVTLDESCSMRFVVNSFEPKTLQPLEQYNQILDGSLQIVNSVPIGIMGLSLSEASKEIKSYLDAVIRSTSKTPLATNGENKIWGKTMDILLRFYEHESHIPLLTQALKAYLTMTFMSRLPVLTERSTISITNGMGQFNTTSPHISSRLLDLQIKYVIHKVARELVLESLEGLERSMRTRTKDSWIDSFWVMLLLCLCIEELQISAVAGTTIQTTDNQSPSRDGKLKACKELEEHPFQKFMTVFHSIYGTNKEIDSGRGSKAFNPIRQSITGADELSRYFGLDKPPGAMVRDFGKMIVDSYHELLDLRKPLEIGDDPAEFAKKNRGRLVATFLLSFVDETLLPVSEPSQGLPPTIAAVPES